MPRPLVRIAPLLVGCRVVAIDQRGHGLTDHLRRPYHIWDGVPDVIGCLRLLAGIGRFYLVIRWVQR